ncbi:MAG: inorganic diphosphatase [Candidatus Dasytiphilus stammeri]
MGLNSIPAGYNLPDDIYVIIEISANNNYLKYEIDKKSGVLYVDRFLTIAMFYPYNYGYINKTLSLDGDPLDTLVVTSYPLYPGSVIRCRPISLLTMSDESGYDSKIIAVPHTKLTAQYDYIKDLNDLPKLMCAKISHFFEHYKDLEKNKWSNIIGWDNAQAAKQEIMNAYERFLSEKHDNFIN